jgi:hypothetical protein
VIDKEGGGTYLGVGEPAGLLEAICAEKEECYGYGMWMGGGGSDSRASLRTADIFMAT